MKTDEENTAEHSPKNSASDPSGNKHRQRKPLPPYESPLQKLGSTLTGGKNLIPAKRDVRAESLVLAEHSADSRDV